MEQNDVVESPARTPEQHMADLNAWLQERGLVLVPVAVGRKSGQMASVQDWEPDSHYFTFALVPKQ